MQHPALLWFIRLVISRALIKNTIIFSRVPQLPFKHEKSLYDKRKGYKSDIGRSGGIRTHDLFHPKEALYQAEPRPESQGVLYRFIWILSTLFYKLF